MICNLILKPVRPKFKRDPVSIVFGSAISAIGGMASSSIASSSAASQNDKQRQWASEEWTRQFNMEKAHQAVMYNKQLADYRDEWTRQFNLQNEYNSPGAQAERLRAAGFNPAMMMMNGGSTSVPVSASMPQSPSVPQPATPNSGNFNPQYSAFADSIQSIGAMFKDLAQAKKNGAETTQLEETLMANVRKTVAEANGFELDNAIKETTAYIAKHSKDAKVMQAWQELHKTGIEAQVAAMSLKDIDANIRLKASQIALNAVLADKTIKDKDLLIKQIAKYDELMNTNIANLRSQTQKNYEEANKFKQDAALSELNQKILAPDATKASITDAWLKSDDTHRQMFIEQLEAKLDASTDMSEAERMEALKKIRILRKEENFPLGLSDALDWLRSKVPAIMSFSVK